MQSAGGSDCWVRDGLFSDDFSVTFSQPTRSSSFLRLCYRGGVSLLLQCILRSFFVVI